MATSNKEIDALLNMGADATKNMYDIEITWPWDQSNTEVVSTRANGFTPPKFVVNAQERQYHGTKIKQPNTAPEFDRSFTIQFRMDATYALYQKFITWQMAAGDPVNGGVANWASLRGSVKVYGINGAYSAISPVGSNGYFKDSQETGQLNDTWNSADAPTWQFFDVWVSDVAQPEFSNDSGDAITYDVKFEFGNCSYPFYNSSTIKGTGGTGY